MRYGVNMSHCRFQNTDLALAECEEAIEELRAGQGEELKGDELEAAKALVERCKSILLLLAESTDVKFSDSFEDFDAGEAFSSIHDDGFDREEEVRDEEDEESSFDSGRERFGSDHGAG